MNIPLQEARSIFTKTLVDLYKERIAPTSFLRSFFPTVESFTKFISIEVQRGSEKVAIDVFRGSEGNRNSIGNFSEKNFLPPYYREFFDATDIHLYDRMIGMMGGQGDGVVDSQILAAFIDEVATGYAMIQDMIERAYELQCAQVLHTGIVEIAQGTNIDFKRKAASMIDLGAGQYFTDAINPFDKLEIGTKFVREKGKSRGGVLNAIFGGPAWSALKGNAEFKAQNALNNNIKLNDLNMPQRNSVGASFNGQVTAGSYILNCWTYPEVYDKKSGGSYVSTPYIEDDTVIIIPETPRFKLAFGAVPQLIGSAKKGAFVLGEYKDEDKAIHKMDVKSAGVAVPTAIDQIWTAKVIA